MDLWYLLFEDNRKNDANSNIRRISIQNISNNLKSLRFTSTADVGTKVIG